VIQGTFSGIQVTFGMIQGTFSGIQVTSGEIQIYPIFLPQLACVLAYLVNAAYIIIIIRGWVFHIGLVIGRSFYHS
jgi:hypothetical protein